MPRLLPPAPIHSSTVSFGCHEFTIRVKITTRKSKRFRRQTLLALFRHFKAHLPILYASLLTHDDSSDRNLFKDLARPVSLHQALGFTTPRSQEGFELRMRRLKFGQTQTAFATLARVNRGQLSRIEHGRLMMSASTRSKIEFAFGILRAQNNRSAQLPTGIRLVRGA